LHDSDPPWPSAAGYEIAGWSAIAHQRQYVPLSTSTAQLGQHAIAQCRQAFAGDNSPWSALHSHVVIGFPRGVAGV